MLQYEPRIQYEMLQQAIFLITVNNNYRKNIKITKNMTQKISWKQVKTCSQSNVRPTPRWGHCTCVVKDEVVLFGGYANSIYMNDLWTFNTKSMEWKEIKTVGKIPTYRSNCSLNFNPKNNRLVLFGGGGENKKRFNQINLLNWETKQWTTISFEENETAPWERTYHSAELLYPYLIIFGGEGIADLDDLWVFNFQTNKWQQVTFKPNAVRPCGRRFHSSCLIGNEFFVIAGCYSKYRPLNDVFSIDLTKLFKTGKVDDLQWKQKTFNDQAMLTRWGQSTAVKGNNIYIFGGRFSNDLSDILVLDAEKNKMRNLKVLTETIPKPRRRSSLNFIGNCLLMFGGFNSDYYNDLHYINITQNHPRSKKIAEKAIEIENLLEDKQFSDFQLKSTDGKTFYVHRGMLMPYFLNENSIQNFIKQTYQKFDQSELKNMLECLYKGYGKCKLVHKFFINLPEDVSQKQARFIKHIDQFRKTQGTHQSFIESEKSNQKGNIIQLKDYEYETYSQNCKQNNYKDVLIRVNSRLDGKSYSFASNRIALIQNSKFFKNLFSKKFENCQDNQVVDIQVYCEGSDKIQILNNYLLTGYIVVPPMNHSSWIELYNLADYLALTDCENLILNHIYSLISQQSLNDIFELSQEHRLEDLSLSCARYKLFKNCESATKIRENNKYYQISYKQNRFDIKQSMMGKNAPLVMKSKNSVVENMEDQKENIETCQN